MSGADIKNLINISTLNAAQHSRDWIVKEDIDYAFDWMQVGILNKNITNDNKEKYMTAVHEAGHALTSLFNSNATPMSKVTILSKGPALGLDK